MKRGFDLVVSFIGLIALLPVLGLVALLIRLTSHGPVLFAQQRVGRGFRPFRIYKFRTMIPDAQRIGPGITVSGDPRVTRIGGWLRRTKLDELPQLFNVLKGDMSLVGPRPELLHYAEIYRRDFEEILKLRPGVTDAASLAYRDESALLDGEHDPEEHYLKVILPDKLRLAKDYVAKASLAYDLKLIFSTVLALMFSSNARSDRAAGGPVEGRNRVAS